MLQLFLVVLVSHAIHYTGSSFPVRQCDPSNHICEGICPDLPPGARLPPGEEQIGLCLKDSRTDACVCWLRSHPSQLHLQTLFRCTTLNDTKKDIMCLPPPVCFPPDVDPGCLIMPHCPCVQYTRGSTYGRWQSVVAFIIRSNVGVVSTEPVPTSYEQTPPVDVNSQADVREFSLKHLLFLLAFVIAPLLCWCMLTFFHEGKCRRKLSTPETEPMSTTRCEEIVEAESQSGPCIPVIQPPTAPPKFECPPPYREAMDLGESCLLAGDCGPPPSYEDAVRDVLYQRRLEQDSD